MSQLVEPLEYLESLRRESAQARDRFLKDHGQDLLKCAQVLSTSLSQGGKLLIFGNGGSASDAQHMAAEMIGRMLSERRALPAIALSADTSNLTALANDYGYEYVFSRQIEALAKRGDVALAISTSGNSKNVLRASDSARALGCTLITLTGGTGGALHALGDINLVVRDGRNSCRIQETHIFAIHAMVDLLDRYCRTEIQ